MTTPTYACDGVTQKLRMCRRPATTSLLLTGGRMARYCPQHRNGAGAMRLLLPYPWEILSEVPTRTEV